jgi:hypothetical protein
LQGLIVLALIAVAALLIPFGWFFISSDREMKQKAKAEELAETRKHELELEKLRILREGLTNAQYEDLRRQIDKAAKRVNPKELGG